MSQTSGDKVPQQLNQILLQETYATMRATYDNVSRWASLLLSAWAVLMGIVISSPRNAGSTGPLLVLSGVVLLILWHEFRRAGQGLGGLWTVALALEREAGIPITRSHTVAGLITFRNRELVDELSRVSEIEDPSEWLRELSSGRHAVFRFHRSWTTRLVLVGGIVLVLLGLLS